MQEIIQLFIRPVGNEYESGIEFENVQVSSFFEVTVIKSRVGAR
jgi:hypothetical protein